MRLPHIELTNFRNYRELELEPAAGLNVFLGANAQGKSNLLEAIAMLGTGKSFRTSRESEVIREGASRAVVTGEAHSRMGIVRLGCMVESGPRSAHKRYLVNGKDVRYARFLGRAAVVTFVPADLQMIGGAPSLRRAFLNAALSQEQPPYYHELVRYQRALTQKNAMLRSETADRELLEVYEQTLIEAGTALWLARDEAVQALALHAEQAHRRWSAGTEHLELRYHPNVPAQAPTHDAVVEAFTTHLRAHRDAERVRRTALVGPHRDDLRFLLGGTSLAAYGSQGQQRTAVLALKVAEYHVMRKRTGEAPILLLDDVLSELDAARAAAFLEGIGDVDQGFVTATELDSRFPAARKFEIDAGRLRVQA